ELSLAKACFNPVQVRLAMKIPSGPAFATRRIQFLDLLCCERSRQLVNRFGAMDHKFDSSFWCDSSRQSFDRFVDCISVIGIRKRREFAGLDPQVDSVHGHLVPERKMA